MARGDKYLRGIQFDYLSLRYADELCRRRQVSRSQLVRRLIRREWERCKDDQGTLPGFGGLGDGAK